MFAISQPPSLQVASAGDAKRKQFPNPKIPKSNFTKNLKLSQIWKFQINKISKIKISKFLKFPKIQIKKMFFPLKPRFPAGRSAGRPVGLFYPKLLLLPLLTQLPLLPLLLILIVITLLPLLPLVRICFYFWCAFCCTRNPKKFLAASMTDGAELWQYTCLRNERREFKSDSAFTKT